MNFADRLMENVRSKRTPLVVGLDPRVDRLPDSFQIQPNSSSSQKAKAFEKFSKEIVDVVAPLVAAVKPQAAFFEMLGPAGMTALDNVCRYAQSNGLLVIMDAKRGDIGSTAEAYAIAYLGDSENSAWGCDCLTVNPYLGDDSLTPFVKRCHTTNTGIFVLVRTSNPGGKMLQELEVDGVKLYSIVADHVQKLSMSDIGTCGYGSIGAVVGATNPEQLRLLRAQMRNSIFLVPGIGAQGGTAKDIAGAFDENGLGAVINSSRAIIFAHERDEYSQHKNDWQRAVELATKDTIEQIASETTASQLV